MKVLIQHTTIITLYNSVCFLFWACWLSVVTFGWKFLSMTLIFKQLWKLEYSLKPHSKLTANTTRTMLNTCVVDMPGLLLIMLLKQFEICSPSQKLQKISSVSRSTNSDCYFNIKLPQQCTPFVHSTTHSYLTKLLDLPHKKPIRRKSTLWKFHLARLG